MFNRNHWILVTALVCAAFLALACEEGDDTQAGTCEPGETAECDCGTENPGIQICSEFTGLYGECECDRAFLRFCHGVFADGLPTEAYLRASEGASSTTLSALTDTCDTEVGMPCMTIPAGDVMFEFSVNPNAEPAASFAPAIPLIPGEEYFVVVTFEQGQFIPSFAQFPIEEAEWGDWAANSCSEFDPTPE